MSTYKKYFGETGDLNINLVCKNWNNSFYIHRWKYDMSNKEDYTLVIESKRKGRLLVKRLISKDYALQIVERLRLIFVQSNIIASGGCYLSMDSIKEKIEEISKQIKECEHKYRALSLWLAEYEDCINKKT